MSRAVLSMEDESEETRWDFPENGICLKAREALGAEERAARISLHSWPRDSIWPHTKMDAKMMDNAPLTRNYERVADTPLMFDRISRAPIAKPERARRHIL